MEPVRSIRAAARVAVGLACLLAGPLSARAQSFAEVGVGWNFLAPAPDQDKYTHGYNVRGSFGHQVAPGVRVRFDALVSWFDDSTQFYPPCPPPGCTHAYYNGSTVYIAGLSANWLVNVDPRGILYGIAGAGIYGVGTGFNAPGAAVGASAGLGISAPIGTGLRAFAETRFHLLSSTKAGPPWMAPLTFGLRF